MRMSLLLLLFHVLPGALIVGGLRLRISGFQAEIDNGREESVCLLACFLFYGCVHLVGRHRQSPADLNTGEGRVPEMRFRLYAWRKSEKLPRPLHFPGACPAS